MLGGRISWLHFALNYLVPFAVAAYSGFSAYRDHSGR